MYQAPVEGGLESLDIRALGVAVCVDWKRLFSQAWVEVAVTRVRLFLTSAYLFVVAWRHPPNCRQNKKQRL